MNEAAHPGRGGALDRRERAAHVHALELLRGARIANVCGQMNERVRAAREIGERASVVEVTGDNPSAARREGSRVFAGGAAHEPRDAAAASPRVRATSASRMPTPLVMPVIASRMLNARSRISGCFEGCAPSWTEVRRRSRKPRAGTKSRPFRR